MTFRPKVSRETVHERIERQYRERVAFYDHISARTQAARDLIAKESQSPKTKES